MPSSPSQPASAWLAAALALGLAGCGQLPPAPPAPAATPAPAPAPTPSANPEPAAPPAPAAAPAPKTEQALLAADAASNRRLLAAHERLRELGTADLAREIARLAQATDPEARVELALALAYSRSNGDLARALALLEPIARPAAAASEAAAQPAEAAAPWAPFARFLHSRLSEQRRLEEQLERQGQQLREQQRRLEQLGAQIDALRAIERSLNTRPAPPASLPR